MFSIYIFQGIVAISMAAVHSFSTLLLFRFLLGSFEAGLFPGIIYYISLWYRRKEQAIRLGFFWSFSALAGAFGGFLAYGIGQIRSTYLAKWQLIFIVRFTSFLCHIVSVCP
jgi:MFS family permease